MIDWLSLVFNSIWIIAIALAVAVFSIAYYQSQQRGVKIRALLNEQKYTLPLNISGAVFCLGMALTADKWWEIILWIILLGLFCYQGWMVKIDKTEDG